MEQIGLYVISGLLVASMLEYLNGQTGSDIKLNLFDRLLFVVLWPLFGGMLVKSLIS